MIKLSSPGMSVRITGGRNKGRIIFSSKNKELRPTTSFFREWIFNVLFNNSDITGVKLLDLYAGTGIVSFEFISRGAGLSVCVDRSREMCSLITKSAQTIGINSISTVCSDSIAYLENMKKRKSFGFNTVFADPPYSAAGKMQETLSCLFSMAEIFPEDIHIICENPASSETDIPSGFELFRSKTSGNTRMDIIRRKSD